MKKFNLVLLALASFAVTATAQCTIDSANVPTPGSVYPTAPNLPHLSQHVPYNQTIQGRMQSSFDTSIAGYGASFYVDSVRLDSIQGMPNGITFTKNPNVVKGGRPGCVEFSGTTTSPGGIYNLTAFGTAWVHIDTTIVVITLDTAFAYQGNITPFSAFHGYYLTVDTPAGGNGPSVTLNVHQPLCHGETGSIAAVASGGNGTFSYAWNNSQTSDSIYGLTANTYTLTVTSNGQSVTASGTIAAAPAALSATTSERKFSCDSAHATLTVSGGTSPYSYSWSTGSHVDSATLLPHVETHYTVTDAHACTLVDSTDFVCTGIFSTSDDINLRLYPNPASGVIHLTASISQAKQVEIKVFSLTGQTLYSQNQAISGLLNADINVQNFAPGVYFIELNSEGLSGMQRFVVER